MEFGPHIETGDLDIDKKPKMEKKMSKKKKKSESDSDDDIFDNKLEDNPTQVFLLFLQ